VNGEMNDKWYDNSIQFPRLLAEILALGMLFPNQYDRICDAMGLTRDEVDELFERAEDEWTDIKERNR
jgi:hypothetical protein